MIFHQNQHVKNHFALVSSTPSVGTDEKRTQIKEFVTNQAIDILFLTETWLRPFDDKIICADLTPSDYTINSFAHNSKGGGIAVIAKNSLTH